MSIHTCMLSYFPPSLAAIAVIVSMKMLFMLAKPSPTIQQPSAHSALVSVRVFLLFLSRSIHPSTPASQSYVRSFARTHLSSCCWWWSWSFEIYRLLSKRAGPDTKFMQKPVRRSSRRKREGLYASYVENVHGFIIQQEVGDIPCCST